MLVRRERADRRAAPLDIERRAGVDIDPRRADARFGSLDIGAAIELLAAIGLTGIGLHQDVLRVVGEHVEHRAAVERSVDPVGLPLCQELQVLAVDPDRDDAGEVVRRRAEVNRAVERADQPRVGLELAALGGQVGIGAGDDDVRRARNGVGDHDRLPARLVGRGVDDLLPVGGNADAERRGPRCEACGEVVGSSGDRKRQRSSGQQITPWMAPPD